MTALSIIVPEILAKKSSKIAKEMHISRSEFIRLAIENEIKAYRVRKEQLGIIESFNAIKNHPAYKKEMEVIEHLDYLPKDEEENWWKN